MRVNKYAEFDKKSFLNGARFDDKPLTDEDEIIQDSNNFSQRAFNMPVYPTPPPSLDYRNLGYVTPVEDQGKV
jgi:hypothetical protein